MILRKNKNTNIFNHISTDWLIISLLNTVIENNYGLENRMWRQTNGWVTCAKPSRQNTDPGVSHTFSRRFLNQNYPKYISDVVSNILEEKNNYQMFYLNLWSPEIGFPVVKVENLYCQFSSCFVSPHRFWRIFSMLLQSHPTIKWRRKKFFCN